MKENTLTAIEKLQEAKAAAERLVEIKQEIAGLVKEGSQFGNLVLELEKQVEAVNQFTSANKRQMDILEQFYSGDDLDYQSEFIRFAWNLTPDTVKAVTGGAVKYTQRKKNRIKGVLDLTHKITIGEFCVLVQATLFDNAQTLEQPPREAAELYREALKEMEKEALEPKSKPKKKKALDTVTIAEAGLFSRVGSGPVIDLMFQALGTKGDPTKVIYDRGGRVTTNGKRNTISLKGPASDITIEIPDVDKLEKKNRGAKKIFMYTLEKIGEQALSEGTIYNNKVVFNVQDLVDKGIYKTFQSAAKGFQDAMDPLTEFRIKGEVKNGRKTTASQKITAVMFPTMNYERGKCIVSLNQDLNWDFAIPFSMLLPQYYYSLNQKAADLTYLISYLARQRTEEIKETGCFKIKLRTVQLRLNLPDETTTQQPRRDILDVIEKAMEEIEEASHSRDFTITMGVKTNAKDITNCSVSETLDNGYLKIELRGDYAKNFVTIAEKGQAHRRKTAQLQAKAEAELEAKAKRRKEKEQ